MRCFLARQERTLSTEVMRRLLLGRGLALALGLAVNTSARGDRLSEVTARVSPSLEESLREAGLSWGSPVFLRIFKEERELEVWVRKGESFQKFRSYPVAAMSGTLGPKLREGDGQAPEGFYYVPSSAMLPTSRYHLAFNIGFPNRYDESKGRTGSFIMVHGAEASIGCFAMTDAKIEEIYLLCEAALGKGQRFFRVHVFPFRMSEARMAKAQDHRWEEFWKELKPGYDWFEKNQVPPEVTVEDGRYHFSKIKIDE